MPTLEELGQIVKKSFPGAYDNYDDVTLAKAYQEKYPGAYDNYTNSSIDTSIPPGNPVHINPKVKDAQAQSLVSKTWSALNKGLMVAGDPVSRKIIAPITKKFADKEDAAKIDQLVNSTPMWDKGGKPVYPADVLEQTKFGEVALKPVPGEPLFNSAAKIAARTALDIFGDPLSYAGVGLPTEAGKMLRIAQEAKMTGETIRLDSDLAKAIARQMGASKPTPQLIKSFLKRIPAKTMSGQISAGERNLLSVGLPFGGEGAIPLLPKKVAGAIVKPLSMARRGEIGAKLESGIRDLLSTKSGDPDFDILVAKYRSYTEHRIGVQIKNGQAMNKVAKDLTRELGIPRSELNKQVTALGELVKPITTKTTKNGKTIIKSIYAKDIRGAIREHYEDRLVDAQVALKNAHAKGDVAGVDQAAKDVVDYNSHLNEVNGTYTPPPSINPKVDKMVKEIQEGHAQRLLREQTSGVSITPILSDREYLPHIMTPEVREAMMQRIKDKGNLPPKMTSKEWDVRLANAARRQLNEIKPKVIEAWKAAGIVSKREGNTILGKNGIDKLDEMLKAGTISEGQYSNVVHTLSIAEVNALPSETKLKYFNSDAAEIFHSDPIFHTTVRGVRGEISATAAEFFTDMKKRGLALPDAKAPAKWVNVRQVELEGHKVSPEIARALNKWDTFSTNTSEVSKWLQNYDKIHSLQKMWTLAPFPAYHTMNAVGNLWNNFLANVTNPDVYRQALMTQVNKIDVRYRPLFFKDIFGNKWDNAALRKKMEELGVLGKGQYGGDIQKTLTQSMESGKVFTLSSRNHFLRVGQRVGKFIEDNARAAHFIDRLRKGDTAEEAAMSVKKYLFDYGDLSDFERKVLNRVFFFYTWTRKNIPLQLHGLVTTPGKYSIPFKAKHEIEKTVPDAPEKFLPEWVKENFPVRIRYNAKDKTYEYFMLNRWLPAADITKLSDLHNVALQMIEPMSKEVMQQLFNYDFFFKKKVQNIPGETASMLKGKFKITAPVRVIHAMKAIRMLNEIDKQTKSDSDFMSRFLQIATGKTTKVDFDKSRNSYEFNKKEEVNTLTSALRRAIKNKDKPEQTRLRVLIQDKMKE